MTLTVIRVFLPCVFLFAFLSSDLLTCLKCVCFDALLGDAGVHGVSREIAPLTSGGSASRLDGSTGSHLTLNPR